MYKYTYLLSQSYRSDASTIAQGYHATRQNNKIMPQTLQSTTNYKKSTQSYSKPTAYRPDSTSYNKIEEFKELKNSQKIQIKKYQPFDRTKYQQSLKNDSFKRLETHPDAMDKIKAISNKYNHKSPVNDCKNYQSYKENKKQTWYKTEDDFLQNIKNQAKKNNELKRINESFNIELQKPLREVNKAIQPFNQGQNVNRARIMSEIAVHLHKNKLNQEQLTGVPVSKKYNYVIDRQKSLIPCKDKEEEQQSKATVAKLTSLQQRIKSSVEQFSHF